MIFRENANGIKAVYEPFRGPLSNETRDAVDGTLKNIKNLWSSKIDKGNEWTKSVNFRKYSNVPSSERKLMHESFLELKRALEAAHTELGEPSESSSSSDPSASPLQQKYKSWAERRRRWATLK